MPATIEDVARLAEGFPEVTEGLRFRHRTWFVNGKGFAWERPLSKADLKRLGDEKPPQGPVVAVAVADLGEKEAVLATNTTGFFTIAHFTEFPAFLIELDQVSKKALKEAMLDAWLACATPSLADSYLAGK